MPQKISIGSELREEHHFVSEAHAQEIEELKVFRVRRESDVEVIEYILHVFGKAGDTAVAVARCESGFRIGVISRTNDVGVMQINLAAHWSKIPGTTREEKVQWLSDYKNNIDYAYQLFLKSGWRPWVCYKLI